MAAQRREDRERADRRQEREEEREERRAERREDRREARKDRLALAEQMASLNTTGPCRRGGRATYRIGAAIKDFRLFDGAAGADGAAYLLELVHLLGTHQIPADMWPRELSLKLTGLRLGRVAAHVSLDTTESRLTLPGEPLGLGVSAQAPG